MAKNNNSGDAETESSFDTAARAEIEAMKPAAAPKGISEEAIGEKTRLGLSRAQAITILTTQAEHDAELAKLEKKTGKA